MTLSASQWEFWSAILQLFEVCHHLFMFICSWSQNFSQVPVRTVIRPLQHVDSSDLQQFCCRLAGLVRTIVLLRDLISARL